MSALKISDFLPLFNTQGEGVPRAYKLLAGDKRFEIESFGQASTYDFCVDITYQEIKVAEFHVSGLTMASATLWAQHLSPIVGAVSDLEEGQLRQQIQRNLKVLSWVDQARAVAPEICQWTGIYYKTSFLNSEQSTDLVLGPYIGAATDHVRIPLNRGFCGMALREEKTVNVDDVTADSTHIACSLSTRSELVIPLQNSAGEMIAELDIDSDRLRAFSADIQKRFEDYASTFNAI